MMGMLHPAGADPCPSCWHGYPKPCHRPLCKGLIHAVKGDEPDDDESIWLHTGCDVCDLRENVIPTASDGVVVEYRLHCEQPVRNGIMQGVR